MISSAVRVVRLCVLLSAAIICRAGNFTIEIPPDTTAVGATNTLVAHGQTWHWRRGTNEPQFDWMTNGDASLNASWSIAPGGFGYGDDLISGEATRVNPGMSNVHSTLYLRRTFIASNIDTNAHLVLTVDYDDGFVAYLDGVELDRRNVPGTRGSPVLFGATTGGTSHEASCCQTPNPAVVIDLGAVSNRLANGTHVLALIGVNQVSDSSDFHIIADLATVTLAQTTPPPLVNRRLYAFTTNATVTLRGSNTFPAATRVTVNGDDAVVANGEWQFNALLGAGFNRLHLAAHGAGGTILTNFTQDIVRQTNALFVGGVLSGTNVWSGASVFYVTNDVLVPANSRLEIGSDVVVLFSPGRSITATNNATIQVQGIEERRAVFLPATASSWGWLMADGTNSVLNLRFADIAGGQVRANNRGTLLIEDSVIRDLPENLREIIKCVNGASLVMRRTYMTRFNEGDARDTASLVEGCLFEGFLIDGMDIKATNAPLIVRRSTFRFADPNNSNADAVDFGPGAGTVEACIIHDFPDKGVSIGGAPGTLIRDSLIYNCGIGVSTYASTNVVVLNTTIVDCTTGILFRNNPTAGVGVATNLIVWGNVTNVSVLGTSQLGIRFSDIEGTNYPGGNFSIDPLFVDRAADDYRLAANSPVRGVGIGGADLGAPFPLGGMPSAPARLIARAVTNGNAHLSWEDTAENDAGVIIQRSTNGYAWETIGLVAANATAFTDSQATNAPLYYRVRATNDVGVSEYSNRARTFEAPATSLHIAMITPMEAVLSFDAVAGQSYVLQARSALTSGTWTNWFSVSARTTNSSIVITNQTSGSEAYFRLSTP